MEPFINWRDEWLLGIDDVDNQHRVLADAGRLESDRCYMHPEILKALKFWFIGHISNSDREFADYLTVRVTAREEGSGIDF